MPGANFCFSDAVAHCVMNHGLQASTVDRELRILEARIGAARLAPDLLAVPVHVEQFVCANPDGVQSREQPDLGEFLDGVGQGVDADAEFANGIRLLEYLAIDPAGMKHERGCKPADTAADDDRLHAVRTRTPRCANGLSLCTSRLPMQPPASGQSFKSKYFMFVISGDLGHACPHTITRSRRMRAAVLGGGPGGLNFAITLKLRDPSHDVVVIERNRPSDTFGWGVVLSDETLGNLHSND